MEQNSEIRLFISSTFQDLQQERDYLSKNTFPELRRICLERGISLVDVDLRWGITQEEAENGHVIRICFEEIDKCRPYFIGIIGDRYGWIPSETEVQKDTILLDKYSKYIKDYLDEGMSITEMEFMYALQKAQKTEAFFYIKERKKTEENKKLDLLINKIRKSGYPYQEGIQNVQLLSQAIIDNFLTMLEREYPNRNIDLSPVELERRLHSIFAHTRKLVYITNKEYYEHLDRFANSSYSKLLITGKSGTGKSALLVNWADKLTKESKTRFIFTHYVGAVSSGYRSVDILKRIFIELKERYAIQEEIPDHLEELKSRLPTWLMYSNGEEIILIIDAVNQLNGREKSLNWLPDELPSHVKLVVSTVTDSSDYLFKDWELLELKPLTTKDREKLIHSYLGLYGKKLTKNQLEKVVKDSKCSSPIFLKTFLDELRVYGNFAHINERIETYLSVKNTEGLFQLVLERLEQDYGEASIKNLMMYIFTSRNGLSENEILSIDKGKTLNRMNLSRILLVLDYSLMNKDGLLDFFHDYLRKAVEIRYINKNDNIRITYHQLLASYFSELPVSQRVVDELPYHYLESYNMEALRNCLTSKDFLFHFPKNKEYELLRYWSVLSTIYNPVESYLASMEFTEEIGESDIIHVDTVASIFIKMGKYEAAKSVINEFLSIVETMDSFVTLELKKKLLHSLMMTAQLDSAIELAKEIFYFTYDTFGKDSPITAKAAYQFADVLSQGALYEESEEYLKIAIDIQDSLEENPKKDLAASKYLYGRELMYQGQYMDAHDLLLDAYTMQRKWFGDLHPDTAITQDVLGQTNIWLGRYDEAERHILGAIDVFNKVLGNQHHRTAKSIGTLAKLRLQEGKYAEAYSLFEKTLENYTKTLGRKHPYTAFILNYIGETLFHLGKINEAKEILLEANETLENQEKTDYAYQIHVLKNLGIIYALEQTWDKARTYFSKAIIMAKTYIPKHKEFLYECEYELLKVDYILHQTPENKRKLDIALTKKISTLDENHPNYLRLEKNH